MKSKTSKRRIVETVVGAALGATLAGPVGAVAGGLAASQAASRVEHLGERKRPRKRTEAGAGTPIPRTDIKRILVPLDFSPPSLRAARFAGKWAARFHAEICLLHVVEPMNAAAPFGTEPMMLLPPPNFRAEHVAGLEKLARREIPRSVKVSVHLREGIAYDEIAAAARKLRSDLIIIATHGRSGLMRALLGSTAERVVRHAPCPVLVLH